LELPPLATQAAWQDEQGHSTIDESPELDARKKAQSGVMNKQATAAVLLAGLLQLLLLLVLLLQLSLQSTACPAQHC
jgi:hypothetical protein